MPDKLTDSEIIKALEEHAELNSNSYVRTVIKNALDLINRLQAENERLKEENKNLAIVDYFQWEKDLKAEAYKEFAEQIFELFPKDKCNTVISKVTVKHILKELESEKQ